MVLSRKMMPVAGLLAGLFLPGLASADEAAGLEWFESKIRPVLVQQCYECHSAEAQARNKLKGGLLLDTRQGTLAGGDSGPAVVPGKPGESLLISALQHQDFEMPPSGKLPQPVIENFVKWIQLGAPDPRDGQTVAVGEAVDFAKAREFWAFQPPRKSTPPTTVNNSWAKTEVDRFILAALEQAELRPVGPADKRTLIRRASFDLTGLPPTPEEVQAFLDDPSPAAFSRVIDRLLESPRYGERWGRHWLDVARYAEDQAHTFGVRRRDHAHQYRDWVIRAFNEDLPYNEFVRLQLAADLIPDEQDVQNERLAGLGLLGLGAIYYKNSDKEKAIADELDDRVDTVTRGFLALTVSCARCHDHKYDPIPTQDYYSIAGIFQNTSMTDRPLATPQAVAEYQQAEKAMQEQEARVKQFRDRHRQQLAEQERQRVTDYMLAVWSYQARKAAGENLDLRRLARELQLDQDWLDRWLKFLEAGNNAQRQVAALERWRKLPPSDGKSITPTREAQAAAAEFQQHLNDILDERDGKLKRQSGKPLYTSGKVNHERPLVEIKVDLTGAERLFLVVTNAGDGDNSDWADWLEPRLTGPQGEKSLLDLTWKNATAAHHGVHRNRNCADQPLKVDGKTYPVGIGTHALSVIEYQLPPDYTSFIARGGLDGSGAGSVEFRVYTSPPADINANNSPERKAREELLKTVFGENGLFNISDKELNRRLGQTEKDELDRLQSQVEQAKQQLPPALPMAHAVNDTGSGNMKVYLRGNPERQGEEAPRRFLRILAGEDRTSYGQGSGRLQLANDIASPDNPLTARVIVNRVWQHHFGRGLVGSPDNFGKLGERPSHPELLDSLTVRFMEAGWSLKWLHREIMQSAVYQLSSGQNTAAMQRDPENRLLWRMSRRRLEVEAWRDALLAVSGNLDLTMGGPTVKLSDSGNHRRTVYAAISRHELDSLLRLFDFPDANVTNSSRTETTVPQQQLFVLNSDFVVKQAQALAARLEREAGDDPAARIRLAYRLLFAREPDAEELELGQAFLTAEKAPEDRLSLWEQYAQALLGSNEFMYID